MKYSDTISIDETIDLINAFLHAERIGLPLTVGLVITWNKTDHWKDEFLKERRSKFLDNVRHWMIRRHIPRAYIWTMENSKSMKLHSNFMIHVPRKRFWDFVRALPILIPHYSGNPATYKVISDNGESTPKFLYHLSHRKGFLKYCGKGMDHAATFTDPNGTILNIGDALGIQHRGAQGRVLGPRIGISHSLASTARSKGGSDETDFLALGSLIAIPSRAPEASGEAA